MLPKQGSFGQSPCLRNFSQALIFRLGSMVSKSGPNRAIGEGYKYVGLGATFAGSIVVFVVAGVFADRWLGLTPLFTLVGTVLGSVLGFLNVYWKLQDESKRGGDQRPEQ